MANKRMFSLSVCATDSFLEMPFEAQCLYFHLNLYADDYGLLGNCKMITKMVGIPEKYLSVLIESGFLIRFDSGVIIIVHWLVHNTLKNDRIKETIYKKEYSLISINESKIYELTNATLIHESHVSTSDTVNSVRIQNGSKMETEISKDYNKGDDYRLDKDVALKCNASCNVTLLDKIDNSEKARNSIGRITKHGLYANVELTNGQYLEFIGKESFVNRLSTKILHGYKSSDHYGDLNEMKRAERKLRRLCRNNPFKGMKLQQ